MKKTTLLPAAAILAGGVIAMATLMPGNDQLRQVRQQEGAAPMLLAERVPASQSVRKSPLARANENLRTIDLWNLGTKFFAGGNTTPSSENPLTWTTSGDYNDFQVYEQDFKWTTMVGATYTFTANVSSDVACIPCLYICYFDANAGYIYQTAVGSVNLNEENGFTGTLEVSTNGFINSDMPVVLMIGASTSGATVTMSDISFTCSYEATPVQNYGEGSPEGVGYRPEFEGNFVTSTSADGATTVGYCLSDSVAYVCGINTTATELSIPNYIEKDSKLMPVRGLGYEYSCDFSNAQSLKSLSLGVGVHEISTSFSGSQLTDLYAAYNQISVNAYCEKSDLILHLPYGAYRNNYDSYGFARVLIGQETAAYPTPQYADYVIAGEDEGTYFGMQVVNNHLAVVEVFTNAETVTLPAIAPYADGDYYVSMAGYESNYGAPTFTAAAPNLKTLKVPARYSSININWSRSPITELYMAGAPIETNWTVPSKVKVYVASQNFYVQYESDSSWSGAMLTPNGWDFEWLTVNVGRLGEFAQTYIELTEGDWSYGSFVKVTGKLNETDLKNMKNMTNLRKLDLSEAQFDGLPSQWMSNCQTLQEVTLPDALHYISGYAFSGCSNLVKVIGRGVTVLDEYAFNNCYHLTDFDVTKMDWIKDYALSQCYAFKVEGLNPNVRYIGQYAFMETAIESIELNDGITAVGRGVFENCYELRSVKLPSSVRSIASEAFDGCESLVELNIPNAVTSIGSYAFAGCHALPAIELPAGLLSIGYDLFSDCTALKEIKCKAVTPPITGGSFLNGVDLTHCTLYVPPFVIDEYRATENWLDFYIIKPLLEPVEQITVTRAMNFNLLSEDNAVLAGNPDILLRSVTRNYETSVGQLSAEGDGTLSAGKFTFYHSFTRRGNNIDARTSLINNAENMRADVVETSISLEVNTWHFFSLQYDVMMEDVYSLNGTDYVIREYNAERRATGDGTVSNWDNVPADGVLKAGKGYIIMAANNLTNENGNSLAAIVRFPSRNTTSKNNVFTSSNVIVPLEEHVAEFAHNRSWNLVGNPYPCYYRLNTLMDGFMTPVVIWRGNSYQAYSPVDDDVILRPCEAFFVQRPLDAENMTFSAEGRMHFNEALNANATPGLRVAAAPVMDNRRVFNFNVEGQGSTDRARIVLNEEAKAGYDQFDAAKFFAEKSEGVEVFVSADTRYDICERPEGNGTAILGMRAAKAGEYTISLSGRGYENTSVKLTDLKTGAEVDLKAGSYTFEAEAGEVEERFMLTFVNDLSGIDGINGDADADVKIYSVSGVLVYEGRLSDFNAPKGVYIVTENGKAYKINK